MIDAFDLPAKTRQITYVGTEVSGLPPINIQVPKDARFVFFTIIGGGGGGARPTAGAAASGGGGGGVGGITHGLFMAKELPPKLYGYISRRGSGGTTNGANGGNGLGVSLSPIGGTSAPNSRDVLLFASGGGGGKASGTAGAAGAVATISSMGLVSSSLWLNATAGQAGAAGTVSAGNSVQICVSNFCSGGAGGGGSASDNNGGGQTSSSVLYPSIPASVVGISGFIVQRPFICIGGGGGGGTTGATGNPGGNAAYIGAGGGGGGNGVTTSGNGGDGGSGAIIMRWW